MLAAHPGRRANKVTNAWSDDGVAVERRRPVAQEELAGEHRVPQPQRVVNAAAAANLLGVSVCAIRRRARDGTRSRSGSWSAAGPSRWSTRGEYRFASAEAELEIEVLSG